MVGALPHGALQIDPTMQFLFTEIYLTAKLEQGANGWKFSEGTMAAVWTLDDIFGQLGFLKLSGFALCMGSGVYSLLKASICKYADIYRGRGTPTTPCDSISVGMKLTGEPAHLGTITFPTPTPKVCTPETDPSQDSCDKP